MVPPATLWSWQWWCAINAMVLTMTGTSSQLSIQVSHQNLVCDYQLSATSVSVDAGHYDVGNYAMMLTSWCYNMTDTCSLST